MGQMFVPACVIKVVSHLIKNMNSMIEEGFCRQHKGGKEYSIHEMNSVYQILSAKIAK